jgi:hypothetical protein
MHEITIEAVPRRKRTVLIAAALIFLLSTMGGALASHHYTDKQLDALAARVGKTYWINSPAGQVPAFLTSPAGTATTFQPGENDSFVITELTGASNKNPYYAVRFESGKVGYIRPDNFHEALNVTIVSTDPHAEQREKAEKQAHEEKDRVAWINAQPWSAVVKEAAVKKQPTPGLRTTEVKRVMGPPLRVTKVRTPTKGLDEEHWFYSDGAVLIFHNGLLTKIDKVEKK